ncbi:MAG: hypothetical protein KAI71_01505 [Candidatus Pacebacteria bacterium]|nr:hypothetical protein [Candidatus Paceibacterota bacterium]
MENLTSRIKYLLIVLFLLIIPISKEVNAQFIDIPKNEPIDVPTIEANDNQLIDFSINKKKFIAGEIIEVKAAFHNQTDQSFSGRMVVMIFPLDGSFPAKSFIKDFNLSSKEKTQYFVSEMKVESWMPAGEYKAEVEIRDENDHNIGKRSEFFEIFVEKENDNNEIEVAILICVDEECSSEKMVFGKNEIVYFKLNVSTEDVKTRATIKTPNGKIEVLNFENNIAPYSLIDAEEGKYSLWANFSKEGYNQRRIEKEFIFEEGYTEETFESVCVLDGKCEGEENKINCPKDCDLENKIGDSKDFSKTFGYAIFFVIVIIVVLAVKIYMNKKNRNKVI